MFAHEKLKVYDKALVAVANLVEYSAAWDRRHAIVDQLNRASESIVLNLAEGARLRGTANRQHVMDYAIGSALECAACLDIAVLKQFVSADLATSEKQSLCEVVKMLVGLRKSWAGYELREESTSYRGQERWLFAHEHLEAYQVGLEFVGWFHTIPAGAELSSRLVRQVEKAATSVVLNIAEGNGRYLEGDRRKFLDTAAASAVKAATYLDLCQRSGELEPGQRQRGVALSAHTASMLRGLSLC